MAEDGKVVYKIEADDSGLDAQLDSAESKIKDRLGDAGKAGGDSLGKGISDGLDKSTEESAKKTGKWEQVTTGAMRAIGSAATDMALKAGSAAINYGRSFEQSFANASTLIDTGVTDVDALKDNLLDLSDASGLAADELNNALYSALSAGIPATEDMGEALSFLEESAKLAKAGFTDINTAVEASAKVLNAYRMGTEETDRVQKVMMQTQNLGIVTVGELGSVLAQVTPTAAAFGVSFEQVGASLATMTAQGTPAAQATTQLNGILSELGKSGTAASKNLAAAAEESEYAGMSFQQMMEHGVPLNEVLDMMSGYAEENGKSLLDMFSSVEAGRGALSLAGESSGIFADNLKAMSTETDVVGEALEKVAGTSGASFERLMNSLKNTAIRLFDAFAPVVDEALPILADLLEELTPILEPVVDIVVSLAKAIMAVLGPAIEFITPLLQGLADVADKVAGAVGTVVSKFTGGESASGSKSTSESSVFSGSGKTARRHAIGEDFVMADWTPAFLDYGERVLTREENFHFNALGGLQGMERALSGNNAQVEGGGSQGGGFSGGSGFSGPSKLEIGLEVSPREMAHVIAPYIIKEFQSMGKWEDVK